ncbi:MAG: hypothetical protein HDT16_10010 [Oscillibacter sp.]|nr:hypothetical protein [Oscillibacter sp.]
MHRWFYQWYDNGIWGKILETLIEETNFEWLMSDTSHAKVSPDAENARGGNQEMRHTIVLSNK